MFYFHTHPAAEGKPFLPAMDHDRGGPPVLLGPLDGYRCGVMPEPIRIYNLTLGGCLIESYGCEQLGQRVQLEIAVPGEGWVRVEAEVSSMRDGYGYVACFPDLPTGTRHQIERAIRHGLAMNAGRR